MTCFGSVPTTYSGAKISSCLLIFVLKKKIYVVHAQAYFESKTIPQGRLHPNYQGVASLTVTAKSSRHRHFFFNDAYRHRHRQILNQMHTTATDAYISVILIVTVMRGSLKSSLFLICRSCSNTKPLLGLLKIQRFITITIVICQLNLDLV